MGRRRLVKPAQAPADKFINGVWADDCVVQLGVWDGMYSVVQATVFPVGGTRSLSVCIVGGGGRSVLSWRGALICCRGRGAAGYWPALVEATARGWWRWSCPGLPCRWWCRRHSVGGQIRLLPR